MTTWDKIYKDFEKGGESWATLSEDILPIFKKFIGESSFDTKKVLDIGCGTGEYLKFLQKLGFQTEGIDSSKTSIKMTKELLGDDSNIQLADMFNYNIKMGKYDLIISISTIHHGKKVQILKLIDQIYNALVSKGRIFITIPDLKRNKKRNISENQKEIFFGTFVPLSGPEKGLAHSKYTEEEILELFERFSNIKMEVDKIGRWIIQAIK